MRKRIALALVLALHLPAMPAAASASSADHATPASRPRVLGSALSAPQPVGPRRDAASPFDGPFVAESRLPSTWPASPATPAMRFLVRFDPSASASERDALLASFGATVDLELPSLGVSRIAIPIDAADVDDGPAIAAALAREPALASVEFDATLALRHTPNDSFYNADPFSGLGQWSIKTAAVDRAWDVVRGSPSITVAVIDTGIDPDHPDLRAAIAPGGRAFLSTLSSGCAQQAKDDNSHGTHVAGVIGATGDNATGIAGVAYGVRILALKALDCEGLGLLSDIAQAIVYAADQGARVISISIGSTSDSPTLRSAVSYALGKGTLVVGAAGNCGQGGTRCAAPNETSFPAAYEDALAVAATDVDDSIAPFSTQAAYVDIAAPGRRIVSTVPTYANKGNVTNYASFSGTSQATPFVAGVAALLWSRDPAQTPAQIRERLLASADDLGVAGKDPAFGAGRVNARRAVDLAVPGPVRYGARYELAIVPRTVAANASAPTTILLTNLSTFAWPASGPTAVSLVYRWVGASAPIQTSVPLGGEVAVGASAALTFPLVAPSAPGTYTLQFDLERASFGSFAKLGAPAGEVTVTVSGGAFGATYAPPGTATSLVAGTRSTLDIALTNTGSLAWSATGPTPVRLSYHWLTPDGRVLVWDGLRTALASDVAPGATVTVPLAVVPPAAPGTYVLRLDLVQEGVAWFSGKGIATRDLTLVVRGAFAATYAVPAVAAQLPGGRALVPVTVRNDGPLPWSATGANPIRLATHTSDAAGNIVLWDGERTVLPADVAPGASVTLSAIVAAPRASGAYRARVDLVREGISWFSGEGVATGDVTFVVVEDYRASLPTGPLTVSRANPVATVTVTNTSSAAWTVGGSVPIALAAHWLDAQGRVLVWDGPRTPLPRAIAPGESATVQVGLGSVPASAASVAIDVVADGLRWFGVGSPRPVTLAP